MNTKRLLSTRTLVGIGCLVALFARTAVAEDRVLLKDGTSITGTVLQSVPGQFVTVRRADGVVDTVSWDEVRRITVAAAEPTVTSTAPTASPPETSTAPMVTAEAPVSEGARTRLDLGLRLGAGLPLGKYSSAGGALNRDMTFAVPATLEVAARFRQFSVGGYVQYAISGMDHSDVAYCGKTSDSCAGFDLRVGAQLLYRLPGHSPFHFWGGLGLGYEWLHMSASGRSPEPTDVDSSFHGIAGDVQAGFDYPIAGSLAIGPFVSLAGGEFLASSSNADDGSLHAIKGRMVHGWLVLGARGTYTLF